MKAVLMKSHNKKDSSKLVLNHLANILFHVNSSTRRINQASYHYSPLQVTVFQEKYFKVTRIEIIGHCGLASESATPKEIPLRLYIKAKERMFPNNT